jgi:hypothetical protein
MRIQQISWVFVLVAASAAGAASAQLRVVEYLAPAGATDWQSTDGSAGGGFADDWLDSLRLPLDVLDPLGVGTAETGAAQRGAAPEVRHLWSGLDPVGTTRRIALSPGVSVLPGVTAFVYYRHGRESFVAEDRNRELHAHDQTSQAAGLAQVWQLGESKGELRLGYEFESSHALDESYRGAAHTLNLGGRIPLFDGLDARFDAGYSWTNYPEYQGLLDVASYRRAFSAGLSSAARGNFQANIHYTYADEESDEDLVSYRREVWGLNFLYNY